MAPQKSAWTDHIHSPISVLNHAKGLHLDRFTSADLDLITGCDDVLSLSLRSNKMSEPVDLARIAHIRSLHFLYLERLNFINLAALRSLPHLRVLTITDGVFTDLEALNGFAALDSLTLRRTKLTRFPADLDLPVMTSLSLSGNRITDLAFAQSCTCLGELDVDDNKIQDLAPLASCTRLRSLSVDRNPISCLAPLAGLKFNRLSVDEKHTGQRTALQLLLPEEPYLASEARQEEWRVARADADQELGAALRHHRPAIVGRSVLDLRARAL
jgi:Leucine-rich repeat (LRR) protein